MMTIQFIIHDAFVSMAGVVFATADTIKDPTGKYIIIDTGERIKIIGYDYSRSLLEQKNHFMVVDSTRHALKDYIGKTASIVAV